MAWLDTVGADAGAETVSTFVDAPQETIVPPPLVSPSTGGARALANLDALGNPHELRLGVTLGEGGMGVVRVAEQVALGRTVAVKSLKPGKRDPGAALDLLREAWITGTLEHPNVVPVHALELEDGAPSIVMKRIEGIVWSTLVGNADEVARRFGATDLLAWNLGILLAVLNALRFAHKLGIIHRDLKPGNVMIGDFGEVYLLDWGIAVSLHDDGSGRFPLAKLATHLAGTPAYMAPEMLGRSDVGPLSERTDVYLAGAVLHEIIAGQPPHRGASALAVVASVLASRTELPAQAPPELARICARAMHPEPEQRFESVDALRMALQRYLEHRGSEQLAARASERLVELRTALRATSAHAEALHDDIYRLFGACRYGFRDALSVWPDNEQATRGLVETVEAVAAYELEHGRAQAALSLLGELAEPSPLLERARAEAAKQAARVEQLERMERDHDTKIGSRTRTFLTLVFGVMFTLVPLVFAQVPSVHNMPHAMHVAAAGVFLALLSVAIYWARDSLMATSMNRRLGASILFLFGAQGLLAAGSWLAGRPPDELYTLNLFMYAVFSGMLAIALDLWLLPASVAYAIAFLLAAHDPRFTLYAGSFCNALITVLGLWRWRPATVRYSDEENVARGKRPRGQRGHGPRQAPPEQPTRRQGEM